MITNLVINRVEGNIESIESLNRQTPPKININFDKVSSEAEKLKIEFTFNADYADSSSKEAKNVGSLKLYGMVEFKDTKENIASMQKKWNDSKMLPVSVSEEVINTLNFRCAATGTLVAYSLGLIPPLIMSTVKLQEQEDKPGTQAR
ncbi:MAG: hypothetical protein ACP5RP_03585 [Candidatus Micrarchaeia archaeon]